MVLIRLRGCADWFALCRSHMAKTGFLMTWLICDMYKISFKRKETLFTCAEIAIKWQISRLMTKPTKWHVGLAKTQISLGIRWLGGCPGWSESSLGTHPFCWFFREPAQMSQPKWKMYLSHRQTAKAQVGLHIRARAFAVRSHNIGNYRKLQTKLGIWPHWLAAHAHLKDISQLKYVSK